MGKQTLFAGEAGLGKSQASVAMAAAVSTGGPWPCNEGHAPLGSVIFLCAEDGAADTIVPRLLAAVADLNRVHIVSAVSTEDGKARRAFNLQADLGLLEEKIKEIGDVRLAVIDPISSYLGPKVDSHVNAAVRGVLEPIGEMATRLRVAVVCITHPPKGTGTAAIHRFIGSVAFVAAARAAFMVTRDADDEGRRLLLPVKNNLAPLGKGLAFRLEQRIVGGAGKDIVASSVVWEGEHVSVSADQSLAANDAKAGADGGERHSARAEAERFLNDMLAMGPVPVKEIRAAASAHCIAPRTLKRAKKALGVVAIKGAFEGDEAGWTWHLPIEGDQESAKGTTSGVRAPSENLIPFGEENQ